MTKINCSEKNLITCPVCKMELDIKYFGQRCPRCNAVVRPQGCESCKNKCG